MTVLIPPDHVIEYGIHILSQEILVVVFEVEGLLVVGVSLVGVLLYLELDFEVLLLLVAAVLGHFGGQAVHPLQLVDLLAPPPLDVPVEVGLQGQRNIQSPCELIMKYFAFFILGSDELLGEMADDVELLPQCLDVELVGVGEGCLFDVDLRNAIDEIDDDSADLVCLEGLLCILVEVVVCFNEFEFLVLILQFQLVDIGKQVHPVYNFVQ